MLAQLKILTSHKNLKILHLLMQYQWYSILSGDIELTNALCGSVGSVDNNGVKNYLCYVVITGQGTDLSILQKPIELNHCVLQSMSVVNH
jgi:hypothetical protein